MIKNILKNHGIKIILIASFLMGISGIFYNYSLPYVVGDETAITAATLKMISEKSLRPDYPSFYYGPFSSYIYLPFFIIVLVLLRLLGVFTSLGAIKEFGYLNFAKLLPLARFISVLFSVLSVYLIYKITEKLFNNKYIALGASFLLSTSLLFMQMAHFGRVWSLQIASILFSVYLIILFYKKSKIKLKDYLIISFSIGVSAGIHAIGLLSLFPFLVVIYLKNRNKKFLNIFLFNKKLWLSGLLIILFFPIIYYLNPYAFSNYEKEMASTAQSMISTKYRQVSQYTTDSLLKRASYYPNVLWENEFILLLLFFPSLIVLFKKKRNSFLILITPIIVYYVFISGSVILQGKRAEPRYILPIIPFMAIIASYGLYSFFQNRFLNKKLKVFLIFIVLALSLVLPLMWINVLIKPSTRLMAREWIYKNIKESQRIISFGTPLFLNENREAMLDIKEYAPSYFLKKQNYLLNKEDNELPTPNYYVLFGNNYKKGIPEDILEKGFDYAVLSWNNKKEYLKNMELAKNLNIDLGETIIKFPENGKIESEHMDLGGNMSRPFYYLKKMKFTGPIMGVYEIK